MASTRDLSIDMETGREFEEEEEVMDEVTEPLLSEVTFVCGQHSVKMSLRIDVECTTGGLN